MRELSPKPSSSNFYCTQIFFLILFFFIWPKQLALSTTQFQSLGMFEFVITLFFDLKEIAGMFLTVGMCEQAVAAFTKVSLPVRAIYGW